MVGNDGLKSSYWELTAGVANAADVNFASAMAAMLRNFAGPILEANAIDIRDRNEHRRVVGDDA